MRRIYKKHDDINYKNKKEEKEKCHNHAVIVIIKDGLAISYCAICGKILDTREVSIKSIWDEPWTEPNRYKIS